MIIDLGTKPQELGDGWSMRLLAFGMARASATDCNSTGDFERNLPILHPHRRACISRAKPPLGLGSRGSRPAPAVQVEHHLGRCGVSASDPGAGQPPMICKHGDVKQSPWWSQSDSLGSEAIPRIPEMLDHLKREKMGPKGWGPIVSYWNSTELVEFKVPFECISLMRSFSEFTSVENGRKHQEMLELSTP